MKLQRIAVTFDKGRCPPYAMLQEMRSMGEAGNLKASTHDFRIGVLHIAALTPETHQATMDIIKRYMTMDGSKVLSACIYPVRRKRKGAA